MVNHDPVLSAVELTLGDYEESNPVKDDLIKRGLVSIGEESGYINVEKIKAMVLENVYIIDERGYLQFGPAYTPPRIIVEPKPGEYLESGITLDEIAVSVDSIDEAFFNPGSGKSYYPGDRCFLVSGQITNTTGDDLYVDIWIDGYNAEGEQVAWSLSTGTIAGHVQFDIPAKSSQSFEVRVSWAEDLDSIRVNAQSYDRMIPSSQGDEDE